MSEFTGSFADGVDPEERYVINVTHPDAEPRVFTGLLHDQTWELKPGLCLYAGNQQGGPIYEVPDPNDSVIEGEYPDYEVQGPFDTVFAFSRFNRCV